MAKMFRLGSAAVPQTDDLTEEGEALEEGETGPKTALLQFVIPDSGVIITQATIMGLASNAEPLAVELLEVVVLDSIDVERYRGKRIPGKIAGKSKLLINAVSFGAIAVSITLACTARTRPTESDGTDDADAIDQDLEVKGDEPA